MPKEIDVRLKLICGPHAADNIDLQLALTLGLRDQLRRLGIRQVRLESFTDADRKVMTAAELKEWMPE